MICPTCKGKGILLSSDQDFLSNWDGQERRKGDRGIDNETLRFAEVVPAARYTACHTCDGGGKVYQGLGAVLAGGTLGNPARGF
jgi:hypothetical protein